ncbi:MAG TPA: nickel-dependent hydrogenase large subunit [Caulobacteraceae bacterium]|nr:nickel-dependent hydrogenase large subunit [Caulobacteraceae bacterium]
MNWTTRETDQDGWREATQSLVDGRRTLTSLWGEPGRVRMALHGEGAAEILSLACPAGAYPSVAGRPATIRLERALADVSGLEPEGAADRRPWLDHGRWGVRRPLGDAAAADGAPAPYVFLAAEGEGLHQIPVGPVHAGIIEPGQFRFTASGETVVRLEERLGFLHRGLEARMAGLDPADAAKLAGRASGDSTVAYAIAFARAVEAALGLEPPPRAHWLRALMAELERIANHLGDIGAICNDAAFSLMHAHCGILREEVLRAADVAFGHRLMMDRVVPGGVAVDLAPAGAGAIAALVRRARERLPALVSLYDDTASLLDRTVGTGRVAPELAALFGAGGYVGRASGRSFDARRDAPYPPYDTLAFDVAVLDDGDVNARVWIRIEEARQSLALIDQILASAPAGPIAAGLPDGTGEGCALVEGFRGDVFAWVSLEGGRVRRAHLRDPSWFQWPLLEAAIEGNIVADFPLCNKSFNCSYAGVDL